MEKTYTKNEIDLMHESIDEKLETIKTIASDTLKQAKQTNGRTTKLEIWRGFITGGLGVVVLIVLPILIWALMVLSNIDTKIQDGIEKAAPGIVQAELDK